MFRSRTFLLIPAALFVAACASTTSSTAPNYAKSTDCKIVPARFVNVPKKDATPAEQAEAELKLQRFAYSRGAYGRGIDMPSDAVRDCY